MSEEKELVVVTTISVTKVYPVNKTWYGDKTPEEAKTLEDNRDVDFILNNLADELPYIPQDQLDYIRTVRIRTRSK